MRSPHLDGDWHPGGIPDNVDLAPSSYLSSSYALAGFRSRRRPGLVLADGAGAYGPVAFVVGPAGTVTVGPYACVNSATIVAQEHVSIGAHALVAWGAVITDSWVAPRTSTAARRAAVLAAAADPSRPLPALPDPQPVVVEEGAWVGFGSVVLPGVRLGFGCVVGAGTVVADDVPPLTVVAGDPPRVIRRLEATAERGAGRAAGPV